MTKIRKRGRSASRPVSRRSENRRGARRALILGGNGFVGSHLSDRLRFDGWSVRVLDRAAAERYREPAREVECFLGDFRDSKLTARLLNGVDTVFHLACTTLPKTSNDNPAFDVESNVVGTIRLLEACVKQGIRQVVFVSSGGTVYGLPQFLPIHEDHPTNPQCSYGISKLTIEKYLSLFQELHGLEYVVLRPSNAYGPRQDPRGIQGAIAVFVGRALAEEPIEVWGDREVIRDYLHVSDLAAGISRAADRLDRSDRSRVYNLGSGQGHSLRDVLRMIEKILGRKVTVRYTPSRIFDVPASILDVRKAKRELGWEARVSLESGIRSVLDFMRATGRKVGDEGE